MFSANFPSAKLIAAFSLTPYKTPEMVWNEIDFLTDLQLQEEILNFSAYGHFSGINRKVQIKYQPKGWHRRSSSDDGDSPRDPSLVLILKWGGELTPAGRVGAEELGRIFRCMYPGGQSHPDSNPEPQYGGDSGSQGLGLLRLHSTYRHDLKIYASDEGRVQMTAAAFAKGLLALEGELTPILVQMVKSANTNGLLDNDGDSVNCQNMVKRRLHEAFQQEKEISSDDMESLNPTESISIDVALRFIRNPFKMCDRIYRLIHTLNDFIMNKANDNKSKDISLYHGESWDLMVSRWAKLEKDFKSKKDFDISKVPDIYDCIKYDLQHNHHTIQFEQSEELYKCSKYLADVVIPQEYGMSKQEKLSIGLGICTPLLKKIRADLQRNVEVDNEEGESINRLNPMYSKGVSSPGRHVRTRLYFTSESHIHSLLTVLRFGGLFDETKDEQWKRAMDYVSAVSELNYLSQIVIMLYEDPTKDPSSDNRFHVELHFSPGVNCCVHKNLPPGPGFRPKSCNELSSSPRAGSDPELDKSSLLEDWVDKASRSPSYLTPQAAEDQVQRTEAKEERRRRIGTVALPSPWLASLPSVQEVTDAKEKGKDSNSSSRKESVLDAPDKSVSQEEPSSLSDCVSIARSPRRFLTKQRSYEAENNPNAIPIAISAPAIEEETEEEMNKHRHSIGVVNSYQNLLAGFHQKNGTGQPSVPVFSTAVISGSTSAPDLRDNFPPLPFSNNMDVLGGVPSIRPLETLHNALSLRTLDQFLESVTQSHHRVTPVSPPVTASENQTKPSLSGLKSPTSSFAWSGPPSFMSSSSGQSSPCNLDFLPSVQSGTVFSFQTSSSCSSLPSFNSSSALGTLSLAPEEDRLSLGHHSDISPREHFSEETKEVALEEPTKDNVQVESDPEGEESESGGSLSHTEVASIIEVGMETTTPEVSLSENPDVPD